VPLYQRLGCRPYRSVFNDKFVGIMIPLVFILFDIEHLTKIRSPLKKMIQQKSPQPEVKPELRKLVQSAPAIISEEIQGDEFFSGVINEHLQTSSKLSEDWGVLEGFSQNDIDTLSKGSYIIRCNQGDTIIHKNHATRTMFLVIDGVLEVQKAGRTAGFVCKGDVTGEYSYLVNTPRSANVIVVSEKASLLAFEIKHMNHLINNHPALAARCLLNLSRSLCVKIISKETSIEPE
jgi:hypothetical protein